MFGCTQEDWKKALTFGDVKKYQRFLKNMNLNESNNPLEATALDHGFILESDGIATVDLEETYEQPSPYYQYGLQTWATDR